MAEREAEGMSPRWTLLRGDGRWVQLFARVSFVVHVAAAKERHLVEHTLLERFKDEVNDRRDVECN
jgi:hypothetical protein